MKVMARLTLLLVALLVGVTVAAMVDLQKRIIRGAKCKSTERLYHVQLIASNGTHESICGGSLISAEWILSADHCYKWGWTMKAVLGVHPDNGKEEVQIITSTPEGFEAIDNDYHDIMLLKLPNPVQIQPIGPPDCGNRPEKGVKVQIAGHGATAAGPNDERKPEQSETLQCVDIDVIDCETFLNNMKTKFPELKFQHWFCGQTAKVDACHGDSGGGVVFNNMIYGVISFVGNYTFACKEPVVFMDVCEYKPWIKDITKLPNW